MKRFSLGLLTGLLAGLLLATATFALAGQPIKLIVNDREIQCDVPPQFVNGRVLVPARFVAEPLGARVEWDEKKRAVVVTNINTPEIKQTKETFSLNNYYTVRQILVSIKTKYPDMEMGRIFYHIVDNKTCRKVDVKQGEFCFDNATGELWFNEQKFYLTPQFPGDRLFFSIAPLVESGILTSSDIQPLP
jgi:hypothetical protein